MKTILSIILFLSAFLSTSLSAEEWKRVYLATFPRSGNHWTRQLIEEATHIATSSVYIDQDENLTHLKTPFPWGGYCADHGYNGTCRYPNINEPVVVKTHYPTFPNKGKYDLLPSRKVVRIVRHPIDSFYSMFCYRNESLNGRMFPPNILQRYLYLWRKFQEYWNIQKNVITIRYEDLLEYPKENLGLILKEIGYECTDQDVNRAIQQYPTQGYMLKHIDRFTPEQIATIEIELKDLMQQFNYTMAGSN
jgi:hypothetical protein